MRGEEEGRVGFEMRRERERGRERERKEERENEERKIEKIK